MMVILTLSILLVTSHKYRQSPIMIKEYNIEKCCLYRLRNKQKLAELLRLPKNYFLPTILTNVTKNMRVYTEEVFGPVIPIIEFDTIEQAIDIANDTQYGLGGYVYITDRKKFDKVVNELKTGMIAWNNLYYLRPCNPFGGYKKSGLGRNNSELGLQELCNIKVVTYEK